MIIRRLLYRSAVLTLLQKRLGELILYGGKLYGQQATLLRSAMWIHQWGTADL